MLDAGYFGLLVHRSGKFLYAVDGKGAIRGFALGTSGELSAELPGSPFILGGGIQAFSNPAFATLDPKGRFGFGVDATNGHILLFTIDQATGILVAAAETTTPGSSAGLLTIDPSGTYLYATSTGTVLGYAIDQATLALTPLPGAQVTIPTNDLGLTFVLAVQTR